MTYDSTWIAVQFNPLSAPRSAAVFITALTSSDTLRQGKVKITAANWTDTVIITVVQLPPYTRYYYVKDHLGSIRQTTDEHDVVISAQNYYAFGSVSESMDNSDTYGKYKYTEKERDKETSYDYFGARYYDADLGRWHSVDPMADMYPGWSPYNYVANNPLMHIDPNGMDWYIKDEDGALHWHDGKYDDSSIPEGYSWLGEDNYFNDGNMYQELRDKEVTSVNLTPEQSAKFAESFDFSLRPLESFSMTTTNYYSGGGGEYGGTVTSGEMVMSKLTYVHEYSDWKENSFILAQKPGPGSLTLVELTKYKYSGRSNWVPFWNFFKHLMVVAHGFHNESVTAYTWSNYPKDGFLNIYRNEK